MTMSRPKLFGNLPITEKHESRQWQWSFFVWHPSKTIYGEIIEGGSHLACTNDEQVMQNMMLEFDTLIRLNSAS